MTDQELATKLFPYLRGIMIPVPAYSDAPQWRRITERIIQRIRFYEIEAKPWPPAPIEKSEVPEWEEVPYEDFLKFYNEYPGPLTQDICGISEPPLFSASDFKRSSGPNAMVAKFHKYTDDNKRKYYISRHLL